MSLKKLAKHVWTCPKPHPDSIWYELLRIIWFSNMSKLVQIQCDTNCYDSYDVQTCLNLFRCNMKHVKTWNKNMATYSKIWANGTKKVDDDKVIPWIAASKSSDQKLINRFLTHSFLRSLRPLEGGWWIKNWNFGSESLKLLV